MCIDIFSDRQALAPILFDDHDRAEAAKSRPNMVAPTETSKAAMRKAKTKRTEEDLPVHSFRTLLADLAAINRNTLEVKDKAGDPARFEKLTRPTSVQQRAFDLPGVRLGA
jgi:hypothetical protein